MEGHTTVTARALLVFVACALQRILHGDMADESSIDPIPLEDLVESFSFSEISKRSRAARFCTVLCESNTDKATLRDAGGIVFPLEEHTIFVTFSPTADDTTRTSLPKEVRLALKNHRRFFFRGGLTLHVASSIPAPPGYIFQAALLTLLTLEQLEVVPTPSERPRQKADILAGSPTPGFAPWAQALLDAAPIDDNHGTRGPPWITPTPVPQGEGLQWTSASNTLRITANTTLSFCPGSILEGEVQPYFIGPTLPNSNLCTAIYISLANPRVFHMALHTGSDTGKEFGMHTFPRAIVRQLENNEVAT